MARTPSRRLIPTRTSREWVLRGALATVAMVLGYISTIQTFAFTFDRSAAEPAHALSPADGRIAAELAEQLSAGNADSAQRARADRIARQALLDEPIGTQALTALALNAQLRGDTVLARELFVHSDRLSQRHLGTQLWLIEDAVAREDIPGALRHYDIALRTSRSAPKILFPVLSGAVGDPNIARPLAAMLATRPAWGDAFVGHLAASAVAPATSAGFFRMLAERGVDVPATAEAKIVNAFVAAREFDQAWTYYRTLRGGGVGDRRRSRDGDFTAQLKAPTQFDWTPVASAAGVSASIQRTGDGGLFDFAMPSTIGGVVLQQFQFLPAGTYQIDGASAGIEQFPDARPYWQLICANGRDLGRVALPNSAEQEGRFTGQFMVGGDDCDAQILRLVIRASAQISGVTGQIERVVLRAVERRR